MPSGGAQRPVSTSGKNWIAFTQEVQGPRGWGYRYVKRIVLEPGKPILHIEHELVNTGAHAIDIEQYNHNWISIDSSVPPDGYAATYPFVPDPVVTPIGDYKIVGKTISFEANEVSHLDFTGFSATASDNDVIVTSKRSPASVEITGDTPLSAATIYACPQAFCVEPFVSVHAAPGQSCEWTRTYIFASGT